MIMSIPAASYKVLNVAGHESVVVSQHTAPLILKLGTKWRCVVSFTPWTLYLRGKELPVAIEQDAE
jgi:hypothetical protein